MRLLLALLTLVTGSALAQTDPVVPVQRLRTCPGYSLDLELIHRLHRPELVHIPDRPRPEFSKLYRRYQPTLLAKMKATAKDVALR